ncbi:DUF1254 domain-containing protein [Cupriavidus metallidurans]|uniref:DUF1254 domain-containing protein n=1 Tax=Cupriavidus metallidurans TaxID=119219 RepID=UPI001CCC1D0A|nr:DUF1254 domain-containing protein [Cupriavidus metallidurans]UBM09276.1 DUF1254 domain-containing protein [Cupriavidus metallidurans]
MVLKSTRRWLVATAAVSVAMLLGPAHAAVTATSDQARALAKEAWIYGYPVVESYKTLYAQAVERDGPNFKAPFNHIGNTAQTFTPKDTAIITPNADTPYSFAWLDLRAEPIVLTLPRVERDRYYSVQLLDIYTQIFGYLGTRETGNGGGRFLIAGPDWHGATPPGIDHVLRSESNIAYALYRTQLFDDADLANVRNIQKGYAVQTLSAFQHRKAPPAAPAIDWPKPQPGMTDGVALFRYLDFMLRFAPPEPTESALMQRLAAIDVGPGKTFDENALSPEIRQAMNDGIADAKAEFAMFHKTKLGTKQVSSGDLFGSRAFLKNNYMYRYAGAALGIYGNTGAEALYPGYFTDAEGQPLNGANGARYTLRFAKDALPPANAFWSITMYDGKSKLLVDNPANRYLINSRMLKMLARDADGGITLDLQHGEPGAEREANWLPAPDAPFYVILRLYMPKAEATDGKWKQPPLVKASQ